MGDLGYGIQRRSARRFNEERGRKRSAAVVSWLILWARRSLTAVLLIIAIIAIFLAFEGLGVLSEIQVWF